MNLLIAIMGDSYEKIKESERVHALKERAQIIVEAERTYPSWHKYHRYMHIVEAADISTSGPPSDLEWEGITGRVKQLLKEQVQLLSAKTETDTVEIKAELAQVKEEMKAGLAQVKEEMKAELAQVKEEMKSERAEVKSMLAALLDRS